ncbi:hypothetical protein SNE40_016494 [Patella caerulea]|uniref:PAN2-PAN3 deadenylation complex subunit PAN3 n=1 Tax=Patella caerulea TaxID=87958 RepID=A0AAN8JDD1_PATCE
MTSAVPLGKKAALCRYFINTGACLYGDECQFLHPNPNSMPNSFPNTPNGVPENQGMTENLPNSGDQYFNATFCSVPNSVQEFQQFSAGRPRPRSRNSMLGSLSQNAKPFVPTTGGPVDQQGLANDFAALNLAAASLPNKVPNDYSPKSGTLSHSASTPSFSSYSMMSTASTITPTNHINHSLIYSSNVSPSPSPGISPTNSPLMLRRTASPVTPLRQTTIPQKSSSANTIQENVGGTTYFYSPEDFSPQHQGVVLPNFTMYPSIPPHIAHMKLKTNMPQFFMPDELKLQILNEHALTMAQIDQSHNPEIPSEVDNYHNIFPLEPPPANPLQKSNIFSYPTSCFKAVNTKDGLTYCLRRVHGFRLVNTKCMPLIDMWKKMYHPNIVQLREVFTTKVFSDNSIVFVFDYFPASETLMSRHFSNMPAPVNGYSSPFNGDTSTARPYSATNVSMNGGASHPGPSSGSGLLPESLIWTYVVQLSSALRAIHATGLACRSLDPTKILIYGKSRLRINCLGIADVLNFDSNQGNPMAVMQHYQQKDLYALGNIVLALACNSVMSLQRENLQNALDLVSRNYSPDLKNLILYLLTNQNRPRSINDVMPMIGARFFTQLDAAQLRGDVVYNELAKEVENGRLFRLLCKFGTINERQEFSLDQAWSETGDRYILKLFRDYLFHQVDENGTPWIDMAHIVQCLNKVDAGVPEKICLMSRDEQSVIVVSYAEIKRCFESSFSELLNAGHQAGFS